MTQPKCPNCPSTSFTATQKDGVINANYQVVFIHCSVCGCVVSVQEPLSITNALVRIGEKLGLRL